MSVVAKPDYRVERRSTGGIDIVVPRQLVTPNVWNGRHWRVKHNMTVAWQQAITVALRTSRYNQPVEQRRVRVTVYRGVPSLRNFIKDDDNLRFAVKPLLDALKRLGLIFDDRREWTEHGTPLQHKTGDGRYWTRITIEPLGDPVDDTPTDIDAAIAAAAPGSLEARFWPKVDRAGGIEACWPWTGATSQKTSARYGIIRDEHGRKGKVLLAHRVALFLLTGAMPSHLDACHACDNPICCNPTHLFWGTHRENMRDYAAKYGRVAVEKRPLPPRPILDQLAATEIPA